MKPLYLLLAFGALSVISYANAREERFFPFLSIAKFPNDDCMADQGEMGTCYSKKQCRVIGGATSGTCANGFGVCCLLKKNCSGNPEIVKSNGTHLVNPIGQPGVCRYELSKVKGACQVRLDFIKFNIGGADSGGTCNEDTLTISGAINAPVGNLCGTLDGQHMYLNYGNNDRIGINVFTNQDNNQNWDIKVTYIRCDSLDKAPDGCLQYYKEPQGTVMSFNHPNQQLNNQDYSICVRDNSMRRITWRTCSNAPADFIMSGQIPPVGGSGQAWQGTNCQFDWVQVLGTDKYCGSAWPDTVTSSTQPFTIGVRANAWEFPLQPEQGVTCNFTTPVPGQFTCTIDDMIQPGSPADFDNTGFCLRYQLMP